MIAYYMTDEQNSVGDLIAQLAKAKGLSLKELSEGLNRNHAYLQQFVTRGVPRILPEDVRVGIAARLGLEPDMLLTDAQRAARKNVSVYRGGAAEFPSDAPWRVGNQTYLPVPVYDIRASAGAGALVEDGEPTAHQIFREQFIHRITKAHLTDLSVIQVSGDSMWETLHDGDTVLVDRSVTRIVKDGIYILRLEDELLVKRCARDLEDKSVLIISDNPRYPVQRVKRPDQLTVLGRVIWIGRALG